MFEKFLVLMTAMLLLYSCESSDNGGVQSIADLEKRVTQINNMNTDLEKQKNELHALVRQFNANLPENEQFDITSMDTLMGTSERELLKAMFREEKDISYNGLLKNILEKSDQIASLQQNIAELEERLPKPYTVKKGDTHYEIVMQYLTGNHGISHKEAQQIAWKTALIDDILPGNRIWLMYEDGMVGSFVTQGDARISPMKVIRMAKQRMIDKAKTIGASENTTTTIVQN